MLKIARIGKGWGGSPVPREEQLYAVVYVLHVFFSNDPTDHMRCVFLRIKPLLAIERFINRVIFTGTVSIGLARLCICFNFLIATKTESND